MDTSRTCCLVEGRHDAVGSVLVRDGAVEAVRVRERDSQVELSVAQVLDIAGVDTGVLVLSGEPATRLAAGLVAVLKDVTTLAADASIQGAGRHALGLSGGEWIAGIAAREPDPPLHRRPWARAAAAGLALVLAVGAVDWGYERAVGSTRERINQLSRRGPLSAEIARPTTESRTDLTGEATRLEAEEKAINPTRARLEGDILRNDGLGLALLDGLARAADEEVTLDSVTQGRPGEWRIVGFALSDTAVQRFAVTLGQTIAPRGLETALLKVKIDNGRLGIQGWTFEVSVARTLGRIAPTTEAQRLTRRGHS